MLTSVTSIRMGFWFAITACVALLAGCHGASVVPTPATKGPAPESIHWSAPVPPPPLVDKILGARASVARFVSWAIEAKSSQKPIARDAVSAVARNPEIVEALFEEANDYRHKDPIRSLVALALLGEMRSPYGAKYLTAFLALPHAPIENAVTPASGIATTKHGPLPTWDQHLTARAVDGLAYLKTPEAYKQVLSTVHDGYTLYVRGLAADAYIWNHGDSEEARKEVDAHLRPGESWIRDRFRRDDDETGQSVDAKIQQWMTKHPELTPPMPKPSSNPMKIRHWYERRESEKHEDKESLLGHSNGATAVQRFGPATVSASGPHCGPPIGSGIDTAYFNSIGGATWGGIQAPPWPSIVANTFSQVGGDWGADGYPNLSTMTTPYALMANSDFLIMFALTTDTGFTFHDPQLDYFQLAQGHGGRFKDDIFYNIASSSSSGYFAQWSWQAGPSPNIVTMFCPEFANSYDVANRAADFMHESWHGWQWRYHWSVNTATGHLPIDNDPLQPKGNCSAVDACDYFFLHKVSLYPPGQMEYSTPNRQDGPKMHMPYQVAVEFLCDFAQRHVNGVPLAVEMAARAGSDLMVMQNFLNPVPLGCGNRRPF